MNTIFAPSARCGSTSLVHYIGLSCCLEYISEPYNPDNYCSFNIQELGTKYELIKILSWPLSYEDVCQILDISDKIVFLTRNNKFEQIISNYISRTYSGSIWHKCQIDNNEHLFFKEIRPKILYNEFVNEFNYIEWLDNKYSNTIQSKYADKTINVQYENIYSNDNKYINEILEFMDLKILDDSHTGLISKSNKLNSFESYKKIIPNFDEVHYWYNESRSTDD